MIMKKIKLFLPLLLWVVVFRRFIFHDITGNIDTIVNYSFTKYFLNNMANGVLPLWDPFLFLGRPYSMMIQTNGPFNPLFYLTAFFHVFGIDYYSGYLVYLVIYFFVGAIGFYYLAKAFFKDELLACVSYLLLLFSGVGGSIFNQPFMLLIFVPCTWFFYFLLSFGRTFKRSYFLGLTLSLLLILNSYIPFYFVTLFLFFMIFFCCLYKVELQNFVGGFFRFCGKNIIIVVLSMSSLGISFIPNLFYKALDSKGEIVLPGRHCDLATAQECYEKTLKGNAAMSYIESCDGSLSWRIRFKTLFSHLDKISYAQDSMFYLSVFCYLLIFISLFTVFDKKLVLLLGTGFFVLLTSLADATPVHRFLYDHIFYFRYFRNLFFFMILLMPVIILLAVQQLKLILEYKISSTREKNQIVLLMAIVHFAFFIFLFELGNVVTTSYVTVMGSLLFFTLYFGGYLKNSKLYLFSGLLILSIMQPLQVFNAYSKNITNFRCDLPSAHINPKFSFSRPVEWIKNDCAVYRQNRPYVHLWYDMALTDSPVLLQNTLPHGANRWAFILFMKMDSRVLADYAKNKLLVYDYVEPLGDSEEDLVKLSDTWKNNRGLAFVADDSSSLPQQPLMIQSMKDEKPLVISGESDHFKILHFDSNSLGFLTNFDQRKFLVYNDNITSDWKVFINGKKDRIYRANLAFKGVWLPAGKNIVYFRYEPPGGQGIYILVIILFFLFLIYTLYLLRLEKDVSVYRPAHK